MNINFNSKTKTITLLESVTLIELNKVFNQLRQMFPDIDTWTIKGNIVEVQKGIDKTKEDTVWKKIIEDRIKDTEKKVTKTTGPIYIDRRPKTPFDQYANDSLVYLQGMQDLVENINTEM